MRFYAYFFTSLFWVFVPNFAAYSSSDPSPSPSPSPQVVQLTLSHDFSIAFSQILVTLCFHFLMAAITFFIHICCSR